jgi:hypothetical protein
MWGETGGGVFRSPFVSDALSSAVYQRPAHHPSVSGSQLSSFQQQPRGCAFASFTGSVPKLSDFAGATAVTVTGTDVATLAATTEEPADAVTKLVSVLQHNPGMSCGELLGRMMECPARAVLTESELKGPASAWIDGYVRHGMICHIVSVVVVGVSIVVAIVSVIVAVVSLAWSLFHLWSLFHCCGHCFC